MIDRAPRAGGEAGGERSASPRRTSALAEAAVAQAARVSRFRLLLRPRLAERHAFVGENALALAARARDRLAAVNAALGFSYPASFGSVCRMSETLPRLVRYLVATPHTLITELRALDVQSQRMGDRFFTEADAAALCMARWARAPSSLPRPTPRGSATLDGYMSEFDTSQGLTGTSWAYDFWDPDTNAWHDTPGRRGLQHIHLSFWEEPIVGRDGSGSGSNAVRLFDQAADILVVFSVGTHAGTVFTAGNGVAGFLPTLRAVLGGGAPPSRRP